MIASYPKTSIRAPLLEKNKSWNRTKPGVGIFAKNFFADDRTTGMRPEPRTPHLTAPYAFWIARHERDRFAHYCILCRRMRWDWFKQSET
ncbi:hypothetical protein LB542_20235 [Mesorhizobium sp. BR1-1-9]|uniref:hypothetical protein n=1 Tax=unclassified Mesorhizobium TaxID=325217 RepID=UPI001CD190B5|nr:MULTISPECIES: hypothetical protein [unclassified Mesorhizobium]MBZ9873177.1 hypothetical protein [Mesorhizobium sp. BR1-1-9]MBZ9945012.1 hypothetical protein [Mesorhizobium sp. BR1-1-13]